MKTRSLFSRALAVAAFVLMLNISVMAQGNEGQENRRPQFSEGEGKALRAIQAAPDLNAKLTAAQDFVKNYPKSLARKRVADGLLNQIGGGGTSLHWPELDEDLSVAGLMAGADWQSA